ncbi:receptor-like protein 34 [Camellia sinensis]|uniref:receptor-like protein 34 n=1 Tax=Camellia sinensis TaxID=4442 RepID=UPI0010362F6A|nr:receptor-like protein 34 [Camellia sinensis]
MGSSSMRIAAIVFYLCFLTFATFHNCFCNGNSSIVCSKTEKQALLKFKQDLKDPSNRLSSWAGDDCCQWSGVVCDNFTGHVHEIHLDNADCNYNGNYPEYEACWLYHQLGGLLSLQPLDMSLVNLSTAVDWLEGISTFPSLVELHLAECDLKYSSPSTTINFTSIHILDFSVNYFGPSIPKWIFSLNHLVSLDISGWNFYGPIPNGIKNITSLKEFYASGNNLNSPLPKELFNLKDLVSLGLSFNNFQGSIPIGLLNMTSLRDLDLSNNFFTSLPNGLLSSLRCLELVILNQNHLQLQGVISGAIGNLTSLISLDMSHNQVEGNIPRSLGKLCKLKTIDLSYNKLGGEHSSKSRYRVT